MAVRECSRGLSAFSNVAGDTLERLLVLKVSGGRGGLYEIESSKKSCTAMEGDSD